MTLEIKVGPPQLVVHHGYTVMVSDPDGQGSRSFAGARIETTLAMRVDINERGLG